MNHYKWSNDKKIICVSFYTADEKLCKYENFFGEKSKNRDKLIQSATPGQQTKNRDCSGKIGILGMYEVYSSNASFD